MYFMHFKYFILKVLFQKSYIVMCLEMYLLNFRKCVLEKFPQQLIWKSLIVILKIIGYRFKNGGRGSKLEVQEVKA